MEIDEKISVRFGKSELRSIDRQVKELDYSNRSEFIRQAIKKQMELEARGNSVPVEVPNLVLNYIDVLVEKEYYISREQAIQKAIEHYFDHDRIESALKAAKKMEVAAGRKIDVGVEEKAAEHIRK